MQVRNQHTIKTKNQIASTEITEQKHQPFGQKKSVLNKSTLIAQEDHFRQKQQRPSSSRIGTKPTSASNLTTEKKDGSRRKNSVVPSQNAKNIKCTNFINSKGPSQSVSKNNSIVVDLTYDNRQSTRRAFESNLLQQSSGKRIQRSNGTANSYSSLNDRKSSDDDIMSAAEEKARRMKQILTQQLHEETMKKHWSPEIMSQSSVKNGSNLVVKSHKTLIKPIIIDGSGSRSSTTENRYMLQDATTTKRQTMMKGVPPYNQLSSILENTQAVHLNELGVPHSQLGNTSTFQPSPIRKFNEEDLMTYERLRQMHKDSALQEQSRYFNDTTNLFNNVPVSILTPEQFHRKSAFQSESNHDMKISSPMRMSHQLQKIRECREHDDEMMGQSPFKTPRSGNNENLSPNRLLDKKAVKKVDPSHINNEYYMQYEGEENIYSTAQSLPKCQQIITNQPQLNDQRFQLRQTQFNLISSLVPITHHYRDDSITNRESMLSKATSKMSPSPKKNSKQKQSTLGNNDSAQSTNRCLNLSPWKKPFFCCGITTHQNNYNQSLPSSIITQQTHTKMYPSKRADLIIKSPTSRNLRSSLSPKSAIEAQMQQMLSSLKTEDCIFEDVDEYDDDLLHSQSLMKRFNINTSFMSPGSRIVADGFAWQEVKSRIGNSNAVYAAIENQVSNEVQKFLPIKEEVKMNIEDDDFGEPNVDNTDENEDSITDDDLEQDSNSLHYQQVIATLKVISQTFVKPDSNALKSLFVDLPEPRNPMIKKTIIFDMDETLVHCVDDPDIDQADVLLSIKFPEEEEPVQAGFNIRPYIHECLTEANKLFQVGVFTASHKAYADAILDYIDSNHEYFQFRLYRDHCLQTSQGYFVKDLRIFRNRSLKDLVLIDNSVYSFAFQIENGVPIIPFYHDHNDDELFHLITYMQGASTVEDIREYNRSAFHLLELSQEENDEESNQEQNHQKQRYEEFQDDYGLSAGSIQEGSPVDQLSQLQMLPVAASFDHDLQQVSEGPESEGENFHTSSESSDSSSFKDSKFGCQMSIEQQDTQQRRKSLQLMTKRRPSNIPPLNHNFVASGIMNKENLPFQSNQ